MALFNISEGEFLIVALAALLLFGSKGIPELLRTLGRGVQQVRQASEGVRREVRKSMLEAELEIQRRRFEVEQATKLELKSAPAADKTPPGESGEKTGINP